MNRTLDHINSDVLFSNTVTHVSHPGSDLPELNNAAWQGKLMAESRGNVKEVRPPGMPVLQQTETMKENNESEMKEEDTEK